MVTITRQAAVLEVEGILSSSRIIIEHRLLASMMVDEDTSYLPTLAQSTHLLPWHKGVPTRRHNRGAERLSLQLHAELSMPQEPVVRLDKKTTEAVDHLLYLRAMIMPLQGVQQQHHRTTQQLECIERQDKLRINPQKLVD